MNPYFALEDPEVIDDVERLLSLNLEKTYYRPGDETPITDILSAHSLHKTAGIFRGQLNDWPLIPKSYRAIAYPTEEITPIVRSFRWRQATREFWNFCERAEIQNPAFPSSLSDRMSIAQHFGVPTPLLDWTQSIFTAVFFAIRDVFSDSEFEKSLKVFVYHIIDEQLLRVGVPEDVDLADFDRSAFVKPYPIDRRIERQRGVFTYHPHLAQRPPKIAAKTYVLEWQLIEKLIGLMKGFGFTEDYFFPDYAGIANAVVSNTSL
ncbi:MAG: hypothetical protein QOH71_2057 [Blastocatellia bacterium]|jgi:hypothetical protein|nr:hypothetical protein [Blastocatellia bacterium]